MENTKNNLAASACTECFGHDTRKPIRISDSLEAVAGDLAPIFAEIDPFPHHQILGKPRSYPHLIALAYLKTKSIDLAKQVLDQIKFSAGVEICFGNHIIGLEGILKKCPAQLFDADSYEKFLKIIHDENALKVLRHSQSVTTDLIGTLFNLPAEFRVQGIISKLCHPDASLVVELAANTECSVLAKKQRQQLAKSLAETRSSESFWNGVMDAIFAKIGPLPEIPTINHPNFYTVTTVPQVLKTADKFANCIRSYVPEIMRGELGLYIFCRDEELALVGVAPRFGKHVVQEIKGISNREITPDLKHEIMHILKVNGFKLMIQDRATDVDDLKRGFTRLTHADDAYLAKKFSNQILNDALELI